MDYLKAFLVGGAICMLGQLLIDKTRLTPARILVCYVMLRAILDACRCGELLGVCLDTCHVSDAGYDIVNDLDGVLAEFDRVIGLDRLKALHLNDSKNPCGAHKDRHEKLGQGCLGLEMFRRILHHPALRGLPMILETPNELPGYAQELALLRALGCI